MPLVCCETCKILFLLMKVREGYLKYLSDIQISETTHVLFQPRSF